MEVIKISSKGQITIPLAIRKKIGLAEGDLLVIQAIDREIRLSKVEPINLHPFTGDNPIFELAGTITDQPDVSINHDEHLYGGKK
ncbi:MAG: AbrB/MazE/SpoVT family DNA-binding domain-containing protein [Bacillota bacterium]